MGKVLLDIHMSLDGFIAGPNDGPERSLDDEGERLFDWTGCQSLQRIHQPPDSSHLVVDEWFESTETIVTGRRTFDIAGGWSGNHPLNVLFFVLTHHVPETVAEGETMGTFVTDGIESALSQAKAVADDKNVGMRAANVAQQYLKGGLLDEIQINLVPMPLGGVRLFEHLGTEHIELEQTRVIESFGVPHLRFRVVNQQEKEN